MADKRQENRVRPLLKGEAGKANLPLLRRRKAIHMAENGANIEEIKVRLGHRTNVTTRDSYLAHPSSKATKHKTEEHTSDKP